MPGPPHITQRPCKSVSDLCSVLGGLTHLVTAVVALVADPDEGAGPHVRVADDALAVTLLAQPPCSNISINYT